MAAAAATLPPAVDTPERAELLASLESRNASFATLLRLIPQQYYVAPTDEELDSKWMKNKKRKTGDEIKEHKRRARGDKLDPSNLDMEVDDVPAPVAVATLTSELPPAISALPPAASISDLRDRMKEKLNTFKKDRGIDEDAEADPQSRAALEAARRQRRGEIRDKRRKERKEERRKARIEVTAKPAKTQLLVPQLPREQESISFPSIALPSSGKTSKTTIKKLSNPSQALAHLESHNAKLSALPEDKRKAAMERELWAKAEERAAGGRVADEEKVLRKAVKREEKRKGKSGKEWVERKKMLENNQAAKAKKRDDNIAKKVDARRNKRLGIKPKEDKNKKGGKPPGGKGGKGASKGGRPGFEGKSNDRKKRAAARA